MFFPYNQNKTFVIRNYIVAWLFMFINALAIAAICIGLSAIVLYLFLNSDIDIFALPYVFIYIAVFAIAFLLFCILFIKTKKGVIVDDNTLTINTGYFIKYQSIHIRMNISEIISAEYVENYKTWKRTQAKQDKTYFVISVWEVGTNTPIAKIINKELNTIYLIPCEQAEELVETINSRINK